MNGKKQPFPVCCASKIGDGTPKVVRSRTFQSLDEANTNRGKPWNGNPEAAVWRFDGMQPRLPPKEPIPLFTHTGSGCGSTRVKRIRTLTE